MGVTFSCFGKSKSQIDHGEAQGSDEVKKSFLQKVVKKFKLVLHKGQAESVASNGGSRVAAAEPLQTNTTTTAPQAVSVRRVAPPIHQQNPNGNNQNSSHSESQQNKPRTTETGNSVTSQQKISDRKEETRSKQHAKETKEPEAKHLVASSEEEFKDSVEKFSSSDDEDVCPTCLEEYDEENPKITSECNHHFHLACIFEWMKRSPSCPVCNKIMVFEPMT